MVGEEALKCIETELGFVGVDVPDEEDIHIIKKDEDEALDTIRTIIRENNQYKKRDTPRLVYRDSITKAAGYTVCPVCKSAIVAWNSAYKYCPYCGQRIDSPDLAPDEQEAKFNE